MHTLPGSTPPALYQDPKRWVWWFSLGVPAMMGLGPLLMLWRNDPWMFWWPLVFLYLAVPLADTVVGEARNNPPEWAVPQLEADRFYRFLTFALVPVLWTACVFAVWYVATHDLPWWAWLAMVLNAGAVSLVTPF